jgi:hypothetical protein
MARKIFVFLIGIALLGCESRIYPPEYPVALPCLPPEWEKILGAPCWRIQWIGPEGSPAYLDLREGDKPVIPVLREWASPVLAHPYWPSKGLLPGMLRPAGAIFPFDVRSGRIALSWRAGPEAWFYREMATARTADSTEKRRPELFDWPRFRALMTSDVLAEAVRKDPWEADWGQIALKTVESGFDRRRIIARSREDLVFSGLDSGHRAGPWFGVSPFFNPVVPDKEGILRFKVTEETETFFSAKGMLRLSHGAWLFYPWGAPENRARTLAREPVSVQKGVTAQKAARRRPQ